MAGRAVGRAGSGVIAVGMLAGVFAATAGADVAVAASEGAAALTGKEDLPVELAAK